MYLIQYIHRFLRLNLVCLFLICLFIMSCGRKALSHPDHAQNESTGLIQLLSPSLADTLNFTFKHPFDITGDTLFTAPAAIFTLKEGEKKGSTYVVRFAMDQDVCGLSYTVQERILEGEWPTAVTITTKSHITYTHLMKLLIGDRAELLGNLSLTYHFKSHTSISMEAVPSSFLIKEVAKEYYPVPTTVEEASHWNVFDCHSHWGICSTTCHCKTGTCCPGEKCVCSITKKSFCGGLKFCFCD